MLHNHREELAVLATFVGIIVASIVAVAALWQANTARKRHGAQTEADLQRRITENYTRAVEQLGSDKLQVRLGGIFALERISQESARDYWTVMETLTAFVRERARWEEPDDTDFSWTEAPAAAEPRRRTRREPPTDIQAILTVIKRRSEANREREEGWRLDLRSTDLRGADLEVRLDDLEVHLEGADLRGAHLDEAHLQGAHLEGANLRDAHLEGAFLYGAHLQGAFLNWAHLDEAHLQGAHLDGAHLNWAHLEGAFLYGAHLDGAHLDEADLRGAKGLTQDQLESAIGDAKTTLPTEPTGLRRPAHWTAAAQDGAQASEGRG